jgi:hypothetical protein
VIYSAGRGVDGVDKDMLWDLAGTASFIRSAVTDAFEERWPIYWPHFPGRDHPAAWNTRNLVPRLGELLVHLENEVAKQEAAARLAKESKVTQRAESQISVRADRPSYQSHVSRVRRLRSGWNR